MERVTEVLTSLWFCLFLFFWVAMITPIGQGSVPALDANGMLSANPGVIDSIPIWAFKIIILCVIPAFLYLFITYQMPNDYPKDEEMIAKEGIDPDLVEMTREEMGRRTLYDEQNTLIHHRHSTIEKSMKDLGMILADEPKREEALLIDEPHWRISALVIGKMPLIGVEEDKEDTHNEANLEATEESHFRSLLVDNF